MTMQLKLTPWFPGDVKPVRVGFYQRIYCFSDSINGDLSPDYWDGEKWRITIGGFVSRYASAAQDIEWRGLINPWQ